MAGFLSGTVAGHLARDPEQCANGKGARFSMAIDKGKGTHPTWVQVTCWSKDAEFALQYLKKGALVVASGELELREYEGSKGKGVSLDLNAHRVRSLGRAESAGGEQRPAQSQRTADGYPPPMQGDDEPLPF